MHPLVKLAKFAIEEYITHSTVIAPPDPLIDEMKKKAGTFVSLKKNGALRGCIGTFSPAFPTVAQEIIHNAISAATKDLRFPPVSSHELEDIDISVDILTPPEKINEKNQLDTKKYGVIVKSGFKGGLLLPDIEGIDSVEDQINIAKKKAGINKDEKVELSRFEVIRYR